VRDGSERIPHLDGAAATELEARGVIAGGMIPKVEAAVAAAEARPAATVKIAAGDVDDPVASALLPDRGTLVGAHSPEIHHA
jgi:acetylglutamate kinase